MGIELLTAPLKPATRRTEPIFFHTPLDLSRGLVRTFSTHISLQDSERIPATNKVLVISNHRSFLDVPLLMVAMNRSIRFACHYYMSQVPFLREIVSEMGAFPVDAPQQQQKHFFQKSSSLLMSGQTVGIFPEGAQAMVKINPPEQISPFHRGFAHLALRAPVEEMAILPIALLSMEEKRYDVAPLKLLSIFDPSEPLFDCWQWHPVIIYHRVHILFGEPIWIKESQRQQYRSKQGGSLVKELTHSCSNQITALLKQGCY